MVTLPLEDIQMKKQTSIQDWTMKRAKVDESMQEVENISEGRKIWNATLQITKRKRTTENSPRKYRRG